MRARAQSISSSEADQAINNASKIRSKKNKHGNKGEQLVLRKLRSSTDYKKVSHASLRNNRLGYDIKTTDKKGNEQFHEVKSSSKQTFFPSTWHIAKNQFDQAKKNIKKYFFWFVNALNTKNPIIKKLSPDQMDFMPSRFQVTVSDNYPHKKISLNASSLVDKLETGSKCLKTKSVRATKTVSEDRQLIAQAVLTRQFLAEYLKKKL